MLNPITYTEKTVRDFLRYQVTTYPFADQELYDQMRRLLNLEETRNTPLVQGPYVTLSQSFRQGATVQQLVDEGVFHPHMAQVSRYPTLFGHQEAGVRAIAAGRPTLVSTGTGSGKTETFLYPIISHCLRLRDENAAQGIAAVVVYPMNALAEDQLHRLRGLLAGTGITFGMYVGKTPERDDEAHGVRLAAGSSRADYEGTVAQLEKQKQRQAVFPAEERVSRSAMRERPPRILLTNVKQLELLLTRQRDVTLFDGARLDYLIFDEAHTFSGAAGAETAVLIRRLRTFCGCRADETVCIATSATIVDPEKGAEAGRDFATRFFGVAGESVAMVGEQYEPDQWSAERTIPPPLVGNVGFQLQNVLEIVDADTPEADERAALVLRTLLGLRIKAASWRETLFDSLSRNELVYQIVRALGWPREWENLLRDLRVVINRQISEEELLLWLALGAAARRGDRPFLRPVAHLFVRGIQGAVVTFPEGRQRASGAPLPRLWLSAAEVDEGYRLNILSCNTCGQHYFEHHLNDFHFTDRLPLGGELTADEQQFWRPLQPSLDGQRALFVDQLVAYDEDDPLADNAVPKSQPLYLCRSCGTVHSNRLETCAQCGDYEGLVKLWCMEQREGLEGKLNRCVACGSIGRRGTGGRYREPIKPVRATTVSDVHVLAQNMIQHAERERLLVFSDNRQDAAFQAGWMRDHARRFRLRALMFKALAHGQTTVGDLVARLDAQLEADNDLSQSLAAEVWRLNQKQAAPTAHRAERQYFLRIQILREIITGVRQQIGLEPWGRLRVQYRGLSAETPFIQRWSDAIDTTPDLLTDGIASLLDNYRRNAIVLDRTNGLFSKSWSDGEREIQNGYMPNMPNVPRGLKLTRDPQDNNGRVQQWISETGHQTLATQAARKWGVPASATATFLEELWTFLTAELSLLAPSTLISHWNGRALPGTVGTYQIDADQFLLERHNGIYRCQTCRRGQVRKTPNMCCIGWNCSGTLVFEEENPDDYNLMVLDQAFSLLRPEEHSAQVPADKRERMERAFKSDTSNWINTLVATPTLEMGVDIGGLDAVLMRNVPPLPANYWQRVGRAGRRHRMAVNLTYARNASHDRAYFEDPLKLLNGAITPPRINLRNGLMVKKHVHASVLTMLNQLARDKGLTKGERGEISKILVLCFPTYVKSYLFTEDGLLRDEPLDVTAFDTLLTRYRPQILAHVNSVFAKWPAADADVVAVDKLAAHVDGMREALEDVIQHVWKRLQYALRQMDILEELRKQKGTLDSAEDALRLRCDRLIKRLKGTLARRGSETEGYDDTYTYGVLAAEGFLPGYGLATGSIIGSAQMPRSQRHAIRDFKLPRPPAIALREYAPGNLIYANGNRFIPRFYQLEPDEPTLYQVDIESGAVVEIGSAQTSISLTAQSLPVVPIADVTLPHASHISDDEDYRFQMPVTIIGHERGQHEGGKAYSWGNQSLLLRHNLRLRLINVGAAQLTGSGTLGYPVNLVSGHSRSPFSSDTELDHFRESQLERYGKAVENVGFSADVIADALALQNCTNRTAAYSVAEALRIGAANVIDMEIDDLQLLCIGKPGEEQVDMLIYDPMPGGSGLLEQIIEHWGDVVDAALTVVRGCPAQCEGACIDCLMTYRNAYYHRFLDRGVSAELLAQLGSTIAFTHDIAPKLPSVTDTSNHMPVNQAEMRLLNMIQRAGFPTPHIQHKIQLQLPLTQTTPDFYYDDEQQDHYEGVCIYLDGLSRHIHGNRKSQKRDAEIRTWLKNNDYQVIAIPYTDLGDVEAMRGYFYRLGRGLIGRKQAKSVRDNPDWFLNESNISSDDDFNKRAHL